MEIILFGGLIYLAIKVWNLSGEVESLKQDSRASKAPYRDDRVVKKYDTSGQPEYY